MSLIPILYTIVVNNYKLEIFNKTMALGVDELGVIISLIISSIISRLTSRINYYKMESNVLRQAYDCKIFEIRGNKFIIPESTKKTLENIIIDEKDKKRYGCWYGNEFTVNKYYNILICQVDNLLYTMYLYSRLKKTVDIVMKLLIGFIVILISYSIIENTIIQVLFKIVIPFLPIISIVFSTWEKLKNNIYDYENKLEIIREDIELNNIDFIYLEAIQDKILINRLNDILVPKYLREFYLKEDNEYKKALKKFKKELREKDLISKNIS